MWEGGIGMPKALAMLVNIEEENTVMFYLLEEKKDIQVTVTDDLIAEFEAALGEEESYFVMLDTVLKQVVWVIRKGKRHGLQL